MLFVDLPDRIRQELHGARLTGTDQDITADRAFLLQKLRLHAVVQRHDLIRALPEQHAVFREQHPAACPQEQLSAERILQLCQLPGKGRLGQVQPVCRQSHILVFRDRQKIAQCPQLHLMKVLPRLEK